MRDRVLGALPLAENRLARIACARAKAAGIDVTPLMVKAGLRRQQVEEQDVRLAAQGQINLLELIAKALRDDLLGFHLACDLDLRELGLLYYVLNSSDFLGEALRRAERYCAIVDEAVRLRVHEEDELELRIECIGIGRLSNQHQIEAWVMSLVRICRRLTNRELRPRYVSFVHRRKDGCPEMEAFMGCNIKFGAVSDKIAFLKTTKQAPVLGADPYLNRLLVKYCEEARLQRETRSTLRFDVENAIAPLLPHGKVRMPEIARRFSVSPRTLMRRLAQEGLTFSTVIESLRKNLARRYLQDPALSISKIAWLLGYQEQSAFNHAFKRWTGRTPREVRAHLTKAGPRMSHPIADPYLEGLFTRSNTQTY
jgi:AraC-like DNA-binding protein